MRPLRQGEPQARDPDCLRARFAKAAPGVGAILDPYVKTLPHGPSM